VHVHASRARAAPRCRRGSACTTLCADAPLCDRRALPAAASRGLPRAQRAPRRFAAAGNDQPASAEPNANAALYPSIEQQLESTNSRPIVYWHLARQPSTGRIAIEYWFFYLYNDFYDKHEADWEGVTVFLDNGVPIGASYSQHQGRKWTPWTTSTSAGPTVYVARGSHANYPTAGRYAIRVCWTLHGRHCSPAPNLDDARGTGAAVAPSAYDLHELGGTGYTGSWGSGNYVLGIGLTKDRISDPRRRSDYSDPFAAIPP